MECQCYSTVFGKPHSCGTRCVGSSLPAKVDEHGEHVYLEFILRKVEFEYVLVLWSRVHAYQHLKQTISFQETALIQYQHHPELLQRERPLCPWMKMKQSMNMKSFVFRRLLLKIKKDLALKRWLVLASICLTFNLRLVSD